MALKKDRIAAVPRAEEEQRGAVACGQVAFKWEVLVPRVVHPVQVAIVEAMLRLEMAVSAKEVERMFGDADDPSVSVISFHMRRLAGYGAVEKTGSRSIRGAKETFYYLSPILSAEANGDDQ